ncbi:hypothetical protein ABZ508_13895 [Streptomyces lavendulocolor]|uniref:Uncharacterized protein n=1 Tax=Streptomyces lavendulocolor TaxID=67316 RepID=A0ABV2W5M8_9ACTN
MPDSQPARRRKPLPDINTTYVDRGDLWRHQFLGARKAHIWTVTSHIDGRVAFNGHTEPTFSAYWINKHLIRCGPDGSPADPTFIERERTRLQEMERHQAAIPPLDQIINELIEDKLRP